ncbi:MAG: DNA repair protein RecO [Pseudomonadota bacterium]
MPSGRFITLRNKTFGESDLLVDALSKEGERLTLTAKNALKSRRRFAGGVLEPLHFVEISYTQAQSGYLYIQEATIIQAFEKLRQDYTKLQTALYFVSLVSKGAQEGLDDNRALFDLLGNALKALEDSWHIEILKIQFQLKFLFVMGFLASDQDTYEFLAFPVSRHGDIQLTNDELSYMSQQTGRLLKEQLPNLVKEF